MGLFKLNKNENIKLNLQKGVYRIKIEEEYLRIWSGIPLIFTNNGMSP